MANKTTNYQLNQWEPEDNFLRTDFNEDNAKIETALSELNEAMPKFVCGTYTGNGAASQMISLGFTPKAVLTCNQHGQMAIPPARPGTTVGWLCQAIPWPIKGISKPLSG